MKKSPKFAAIATGVVSLMFAAFTVAPALASSPGQIDGGDIYRVKNVTQNSAFGASASAVCGDEVQYKVLLHNSGFGSVDNVVASATLPSSGGTSHMNVTYQSTGPVTSVSGDASLSVASGSVSYESGTSQVLDSNNSVIKSLADGVTNGGVNIGSVPGSTAEFVTFKAKVNCPEKPTCKTDHSLCPKPTCKTDHSLCPKPTCKTDHKLCPPSTPPTTPPATTTPTTLVNTGPGDVLGAFSVATIAGALGYRRYLSRRLARQ